MFESIKYLHILHSSDRLLNASSRTCDSYATECRSCANNSSTCTFCYLNSSLLPNDSSCVSPCPFGMYSAPAAPRFFDQSFYGGISMSLTLGDTRSLNSGDSVPSSILIPPGHTIEPYEHPRNNGQSDFFSKSFQR
jgi:hypothetical protein